MYFWLFNTCLIFMLCILFAKMLIPKIIFISHKKKLFDVQDERKTHQGTIPHLGGFAFKPVIFISIVILLGINLLVGRTEMLRELQNNLQELSFAFCAISILYLLGIADDLVEIRYCVKFFAQILCGLLLIAGGIWIDDMHGLLGIHALPVWVSYPLTVFILVYVINAINLIDGIDGLASGLSGVALLVYGAIFFFRQEYIYVILSMATLGVLVVFFYYNVFGKAEQGKKIFMGDTGSLTIGFMLCFLAIKLSRHTPADEEVALNFFIWAFTPMLLPCLDVLRVFLRRIRHRKNPFMPDRSHIHHKMLALGIPQNLVMITLVFAALILTLCNRLLIQFVDINIVLVADLLIWTLINIRLSRKIKQRQSKPVDIGTVSN